MAKRVCLLFSLFLAIYFCNAASEYVYAPLEEPAIICHLCKCKMNQKIDCVDKNLTTFFTKDEWAELQPLNMVHVDLSENLITEVTVIAELAIKVLNLSYNMIEVIENCSFKNLRQLEVLDLSHNSLTKLGPHVLEGHYSPDIYEPLTALRSLSLAYNDFHSLHPDQFMHVPELTELDLSGNPLKTIDHVTLIAVSSLPKLRVLRMSSCQIDEIPEKFLHVPRYLERLDISDNQLTAIPRELEETKNLVFLNLSQNPIVMLDADSEDYPGFPRLQKLRELHMSNMPELWSIGAGTLAGIEGLVKLHMSFNPNLSKVDRKAMARTDDIGGTLEWPPIKELYLQSNNLSEVDAYLLNRWDLVEKIDFSDNPYACDCPTEWMVVLAPMFDAKGGDSSLMICQEPVELRGYSMKQLHDAHHVMNCSIEYSNDHEKDDGIFNSTMIGYFTVSLVMSFIGVGIVLFLFRRMRRSRSLRRHQDKYVVNAKLEDGK